MALFAIASSLLQQDYHGYTDTAQARKDALHKEGKTFLRRLAKTLGLPVGSYNIRCNRGGIAVSGEVTLHGDRLYVQLAEMAIGSDGLELLYRPCRGKKDYTGGPNQFVSLRTLAKSPEKWESFLEDCRHLSREG